MKTVVSDCGSGGRRLESGLPSLYNKKHLRSDGAFLFLSHGQLERHATNHTRSHHRHDSWDSGRTDIDLVDPLECQPGN